MVNMRKKTYLKIGKTPNISFDDSNIFDVVGLSVVRNPYGKEMAARMIKIVIRTDDGFNQNDRTIKLWFDDDAEIEGL